MNLPTAIPSPSIISNNNAMVIEFLVQMVKFDKCRSVTNDDIFNLHLGSGGGPWSQHPLPSARHQPHLLIPSGKTIYQKKTKNPKMRFNSQQIVSYCLGLRTQNPGLRELDLEVSPKTDSHKINMLN